MAGILTLVRESDGDASDNLKKVTTIQSSPQSLPFVEDQEIAGATLIECVYSIGERSLFREQLGGKRIEERSDRLTFQHGLAYRQTAPEIGAAGDGFYEQFAKRREGTRDL